MNQSLTSCVLKSFVWRIGFPGLLVLGGCGSSSESGLQPTQALGDGVVATNLGVALVDLRGEGNFYVINVREFDQGGSDLNGDGDPFDRVMYVFDARTRSLTNTGLASGQPSYVTGFPEARVSPDFVVLPVEEMQQGATDLNGDGDTSDFILHVFNPTTGIALPIEYAAEPFVGPIGLAIDGDFVAFTVPEAQQGNLDVNGDGDMDDRFVYLFDTRTGVAERISESASTGVFAGDSNLIYSQIEDAFSGDLNGDGDEEDRVLHLRDLATGAITNVGLAGLSVLGPVQGAWTFSTLEWSQGGMDLNGDLDAHDVILTSYDPSRALVHNHAVGSGNLFTPRSSVGHDLVATRIEEAAMDRDLNGDGDILDAVVYALDPVTGETFNSGLAGDQPVLFDGWLGVDVCEVAQGGTDLNGDGVIGGHVLHVLQPRSGTVMNLGVVAVPSGGNYMEPGGRWLLFWRNESLLTGDWNGDGDINDRILWWWDPTTNQMTRMSRSGERIAHVLDGTALVWVSEAAESEDLNDDGDTIDFVAFALDLATGQLASTGLGGEHPFGWATLLDSRTALLGVPEVAGLEDLNGDGDIFDAVLFLLDLFR